MDDTSAEDGKKKKSTEETATDDDKSEPSDGGGKESGGAAGKKPARQKRDFPWKLHVMLEDAERENNQHIVSWDNEGKSFKVFKIEEFVNEILPRYFNQTQFRSFQRMLNLYDYSKLTRGPNKGGYTHPKFVKDDRDLCLEMKIRPKTKYSVSSLEARLADWTQARAQRSQGAAEAASFSLQEQQQHPQQPPNIATGTAPSEFSVAATGSLAGSFQTARLGFSQPPVNTHDSTYHTQQIRDRFQIGMSIRQTEQSTEDKVHPASFLRMDLPTDNLTGSRAGRQQTGSIVPQSFSAAAGTNSFLNLPPARGSRTATATTTTTVAYPAAAGTTPAEFLQPHQQSVAHQASWPGHNSNLNQQGQISFVPPVPGVASAGGPPQIPLQESRGGTIIGSRHHKNHENEDNDDSKPTASTNSNMSEEEYELFSLPLDDDLEPTPLPPKK